MSKLESTRALVTARGDNQESSLWSNYASLAPTMVEKALDGDPNWEETELVTVDMDTDEYLYEFLMVRTCAHTA